MTAKKRIWFWLGLALAVVPEILWSPVGNVFYSFYQNNNYTHLLRDTWVTSVDNFNSLSIILFLQFLGLLLASTTGVLFTKKLSIRLAIGILGYGICAVVLILFGLTISLRSIGL